MIYEVHNMQYQITILLVRHQIIVIASQTELYFVRVIQSKSHVT